MTTPITRRQALSMMVNLAGGVWAAVLTVLSGAYLSSNIRFRSEDRSVMLGDLSIYGDSFRPVRLRVQVDDGWYKRVDERTMYIRANPEDPAHPIVLSAKCSHLG